MGTMLQASLRAPVTKVITPLARGLIKMRVSANLVSVFGALATSSAALLFFPSGRFGFGTFFITLFVLFDLLDGTIARLSSKGANGFGALLDSTLDRIGDASVLGSLLWYLIRRKDSLTSVMVIAIAAGFMVSYVKARAEAVGIECNGGFAERTERLVIILVATGLAALNLAYVLAIGIWVLAVASCITVIQRFAIVYRSGS
jgi:CDP-diacylglycerol--glycerol-3-phosphate 3-phosphatidyltransferase